MIIALPHPVDYPRSPRPCPGMSHVVASVERIQVYHPLPPKTLIGRCSHCGERVRVCTTQGGEVL